MKSLLRILHLEDNQNDAELVCSMLEADGIMCDVVRAETRDDFHKALEDDGFDLIISDYTLPSFDGLSALKIAQEKSPDIPFIFVSGTIGEDSAIESLLSGATDYVLKNKLSRLVPAVRRALHEAEFHKEQKRANEELAHQARMAAFRADVGFTLSHGGTLDTMLQKCTGAVIRHLDAALACIWVSTLDRNILELQAKAGMSTLLDNSYSQVPVGKSKIGLIVQERKAQLMNSVPPDAGIADQEWAKSEGIVSFAGFPLLAEDRAVGVIAMFGRKPLTDRILSPLAAVSVAIAQTIERKRAEEKIREQAALIDVDPDAILVHDMEERITFYNKGAERLYGWTKEEILGKRATETIFKDNPAQFEEAKTSLLTHGRWEGEWKHHTKDGKELIVESHWTLVRDHKGEPAFVYVVNTDITEKKKLEQQFLRAQRMDSIGTLAGGIAHDLNNVLAPILMAVDILKRRFSDIQGRRILDTLEASAKRGADLVKQVLTFARGAEGEREVLQLKHVINEMVKIVNEIFPKSLQVQTDIPNNLQPVLGDPTQLHQVLLNLCVNARDAMPDGGILTIGAENVELDENYARMHIEAKAGPYVLIKVSDTGTGIPPYIIDKIFEPFFTTKERGKGTGLGLSTVHAIVKSHKGFINVYSEVGKGTTFNVYLPAQTEHEVASTPEKRLELPSGHGETILVVDDESAICEIAKQTLETYGYRVITAGDGIEALALYAEKKEEVDVVLIDMMMPNISGQATIRAMRNIDPDVKIIATSGLPKLSTGLLGTDVQAFLLKPYTAEKLLTTLHGLLK